ncbi:MAG: hypothetical protein UHH95_06005 [Oscillospiraceae bacterium]|nr:hypothetical protein [Oscillospiraceae bacterium]
MRKKSSNMAAGVAIGMTVGAALGAIGAISMPNMASSKFMKKAKKTVRRNADRAISGIESIMDSIPKMMG